MNEMSKTATLERLWIALKDATNCGLLDDLTTCCHPDSINAFCDGVKHLIDETQTLFVECIDNIQGDLNIAVGHTYKVIYETNHYYHIVDDQNREGGFHKRRFKLVNTPTTRIDHDTEGRNQ